MDDAGDVGTFGAFTVALDGRPSNLRALTAEQAARGSGAESAAEVLGAIFAEIGVEHGLSRIEGSFALVVWDAGTQELWAVRDRMGARPMFWRQDASGMAAGSTPEAVGAGPVNVQALDRITRIGVLPPPVTTVVGVQRVAAGCCVRMGKAATETRWWDAPGPVGGRGGSLTRWVQSLEFSARMCVRHACSAAQAVWAEDAAGLAVLAAAAHPVTGPVPVIVVDVEGAERLPDPTALRVYRTSLGPEQLDEALDDLAALDEPVADPDALLWWAVGRVAEREDFRGVMTGRGSEAWLEPAGPGRIARAIRRHRPIAPAPTCPEIAAILATAATDPPAQSWVHRRVSLPDRTLRTADLVGSSAGVTFLAPLCDPRLVQLGCTVPADHHARIAPLLWRAMGAAAPEACPKRVAVPLLAWLSGPCAHLLEGVPERLAAFIDPASLEPWPWPLHDSEAVAERVFALLVLERWLRGRG